MNGHFSGKTVAVALAVATALAIMPQAEAKDKFVETTQMITQVEESDHYFDGEQQSVAPAADFVQVCDHHRVLLDNNGKAAIEGLYPEIRITYAPMKKWGKAVNRKIRQQYNRAEQQMLKDYQESTTSGAVMMPGHYWSKLSVCQWGRTDTEVLSFCLRDASYFDGAHPSWSYLTKTYDAVQGRELSIDDVVVSEDELLAALARAFRREYDERYVYSGNIDTELAKVHSGENWQQHLRWLMLPDGGLRVFYAPYVLGPFASGEFILTIPRAEEPQLFRADRLY